jgi:hypothetical protein
MVLGTSPLGAVASEHAANKAMQLTGRRIEPVPDWGGRRPPRSARFAGGRRAVRGTFTGGRQLIAGPLGSMRKAAPP